MADITWPDDLAPYRVAYYPQGHVGGSESPLTRTHKTYVLGRARWVARFTFRGGYWGDNFSGAEGFGPRLDAMIADITEHMPRVALFDFRRPKPLREQFVGPGGLTHVGAAKGDTAIGIAGFAPGSLAFSIGDYVGGDGRAHIVRALAYADDSGVAMASITPPLETAVIGGTPAPTSQVCSWFRLRIDNADDAGANETEVGGPTEYVLDFVEDLT